MNRRAGQEPDSRGPRPAVPGLEASRERVAGLFLRLLGLVYLSAFSSLAWQAEGLIGSSGILPLRSFLAFVRGQVGSQGYFLVPTIFWLDASDLSIRLVLASGVVLSLPMVFGASSLPLIAAPWALYLSVCWAGQVFLSYQWDNLLLEAGLLACLLGTLRNARVNPDPGIFALRFLLFRLMVSSGAVKLLSGDPNWRNLTALQYHYETQPLPTPLGFFAHFLPPVLQRASCLGMLVVEILAPILLFLPRRARLTGAALVALFQLSIAATGNYGFFNFLTIALCATFLDDAAVPSRFFPHLASRAPVREGVPSFGLRVLAAGVLAALSLVPFLETLGVALPGAALRAYAWEEPFRSVNGYGLFAVMTTSRPEIVVEGSLDGEEWRAYAFPFKPGDPGQGPRFVAPHQPRLDWQMWFAALGVWRDNPWFRRFEGRLLEGSPEVLSLLASNPFPDAPPRYVRAQLYDYHFDRSDGGYWRRELLGPYGPILSRAGGR